MLYFQSISILPLIYVDGPYEVHPLLRINLPNPLKKGSRVIPLYHLFSYTAPLVLSQMWISYLCWWPLRGPPLFENKSTEPF